MKIGLISDTHMSSGKLPQAIVNTFQDVDLILHAGDLVAQNMIRLLERIAPVTAVHGNMDMAGVKLNLPSKGVIEVEGHRIGLIHGHRVPHPNRVLSPPIDLETIHDYLLSEFQGEEIDCIVYGHTHQAHVETYREVLFINPGSATRGKGGHSTVGLLTINQDQIRGEIIPLT